jgi:hypothetical protein
MRASEHANRQPLDLDDLTVGPSVVELHGVDRSQDIDTAWGNANLKDQIGCFQVIFRQPGQGGAKSPQCSPDPYRILLGTPNPDIHITGRSGEAMGG